MQLQKEPPRGVLKKRYSENMQQIYRRAPMPKCEFAAYFQNTFSKKHLWVAASAIIITKTWIFPNYPYSTIYLL